MEAIHRVSQPGFISFSILFSQSGPYRRDSSRLPAKPNFIFNPFFLNPGRMEAIHRVSQPSLISFSILFFSIPGRMEAIHRVSQPGFISFSILFFSIRGRMEAIHRVSQPGFISFSILFFSIQGRMEAIHRVSQPGFISFSILFFSIRAVWKRFIASPSQASFHFQSFFSQSGPYRRDSSRLPAKPHFIFNPFFLNPGRTDAIHRVS
jgi:hypothetical protein